MTITTEVQEQELIFKELINEFKKPEPNENQIQKCMDQLSLDYQPDHFANMQKVLTALNFHFRSGTLEES
ncbi:MAG: hypothetical protein AAF202_04685 [Pseudomonadota bacterium]